jgi:hypothetical protein
MVQISAEHKIHIPSKNQTMLEWQGKTINVQELTDTELFALRVQVKNTYTEQMGVIDDEINNWQPIYCAVCGAEDLAFRGRPFVTWGLRGGYPLCPRHTRAFDRYGTPEAKLLAEAKAEDAEIKELFG